MTAVLTADDAQYQAIFDVATEAQHMGNAVDSDVYDGMNALRNRSPVHKGSVAELLGLDVHSTYDTPRQHYSLLSFKACDRAFRDNIVFSSKGYEEDPVMRTLGRSILSMVGAEHRHHRALVQPRFIKPRAQTWWKDNWIQEIVDTLLERCAGQDRLDLSLQLCARLPLHTITRAFGMDGQIALDFRTNLLKATVGPDRNERMAADAEVRRMLSELIARKRREPGDDIMTTLVNADLVLDDGATRKLDDEEIFGYSRLIMLAGGGTTWRQLGITLHALLSNYKLWEAVRDDRSLVEPAIEESLRWNATDPIFYRLLTQDVEVEGVPIPAGSRIDVCLGAANRDPTRWENPDAYDPFRPLQGHLGFGIGPHQCLGMNVAKQEMLVALNGLMDRFPTLRLDPDAPAPRLTGGLHQRGMSAVPVILR
jgi:cytochrome P450